MKTIKALFLVAVLAFAASCSEDTEMNLYPARSNEAFFGTTSHKYAVSGDLENAYTITVTRALSQGEASVPVSISGEKVAAFTAPAAVLFADGSQTGLLKLTFDREQFVVGENNEITITLDSETDLPYATSCTLNVVRDYTWQAYGEGTFTSDILSAMFGTVVAWPQAIERALENQNLYRLPDCYHNAGTNYSEAGYNIVFTWDGGAAIAMDAPADDYGCATVESGWSHPSYGMISLYVDQDPIYSGYDAANNALVFNCCALVSLSQLTNWGNEVFAMGGGAEAAPALAE